MARAVGTSFDVEGWRLAANAIRLVEAEGRPDGRGPNSYFVGLYRSLADALASGTGFLFGLEGREHTAHCRRFGSLSSPRPSTKMRSGTAIRMSSTPGTAGGLCLMGGGTAHFAVCG